MVVDPKVLETLRCLDQPGQPSFLAEIIEIFFEDTPPRLADLRRALAAGDVETLTQISHTLKGSCGNFGAEAMQARCRELELRGRGGTLDCAPELIEEIELEYGRVHAALSVYL
ncbi:MAG TPA: Hpt domain-containing protein [Kofleriaceae bacterium]|nr:Hpt domain-containing protein [Kofleriaceae bacterium]